MEGEALFVPPQPSTSSFTISAPPPVAAKIEEKPEALVSENSQIEVAPVQIVPEQVIAKEVPVVAEEIEENAESTEIPHTDAITPKLLEIDAEAEPVSSEEIDFSESFSTEDMNDFAVDELLHEDSEATEFDSTADDMGMTEEELAAFIEAESAEGLEESGAEFQMGEELTDDDLTHFSAVESDETEQPIESLQQNTHLTLEEEEDPFAGLELESSDDPDSDLSPATDEDDEFNLETTNYPRSDFATDDEDDLDKLLSRLNDGDLGDFDETETSFDSADEISGKFDLAQMYLDMQDSETARNILSEILAEGDNEQQRKARELMDEIA
jgi:pilus assembly protein FimV